MPLLRPPEPQIVMRKFYVRIEEPLARTHGALRRVPRHRQPRPCREPGSAVHIQTRQPVQVLAGTKPRSNIKATPVEDQLEEHEQQWRPAMIQRALASKGLVAYVLACATGITLYFRWPFPENDLMLHLISIRAPLIYAGFKYTYTLFLFTTPYIGYSLVLSGLYVFAFRPNRKIKPMPLPAYPDPSSRDELFLVLGEVHDPRKPVPAEQPYWLDHPERGLFTGIAIFGAIGTGKTSGCMYPYAEQLIAYRADDPDKRIGGLVLEVKGDFCHKVKDILKRHGREDDYVEVNLNADYRYNPLYNDLDAYALAYNIASLLNNLFGKGKEPFWQQAYTNLVKFIIQLHKVAYDYVTLFDVYECAINPELLEKRIHEAERRSQSRSYCVIADQIFLAPSATWSPSVSTFDEPAGATRRRSRQPWKKLCEAANVNFHCETENPPAGQLTL